MRRTLALALYYGLASRLPDRYLPGGEYARRFRQALSRRFFAQSEGWVNIGPSVFVADGSNVSIGNGSGIGLGSRVYGAVIGDNVMIGPYATLLKSNHRFDDPSLPMGQQGDTEPRPPIIEDGAWLGERVIVLEGRRIGRGAIVGAGAVVTKDVEPFTIVAGNPARVIGVRPGIAG